MKKQILAGTILISFIWALAYFGSKIGEQMDGWQCF